MGAFRRRIVISHTTHADAGCVRAVLEDDFHHFRVALSYAQGHVTEVEADSLRNPYSLCPTAGRQLGLLVGMALSPVASSVNRHTDPAEQCTHQFDLAGLAVATAVSGRPWRQYDIEIPDRVSGGTQALLSRDGEPVLAWDLCETSITGPTPYAGISLREGFARWATTQLSSDEAEAAIVLRRCALISLGRGRPLDEQVHAVPTGLCFAQQPTRAVQALRVVGSTWDFSPPARHRRLCEADTGWLSFKEDCSGSDRPVRLGE